MDRESLLAAARVCRDRADVHGQRHAVAFEMEALMCERAIIALAEQRPCKPKECAVSCPPNQVCDYCQGPSGEDQRGADRPVSERGRVQLPHAPHHDPAGQASPSVAAAESPKGADAPALPGPVAYVRRALSDGSITDRIAPVGYSDFDKRIKEMQQDPWIVNGRAEIVPLYAAPALPGPETVPVPREPTQDWMREFCRRPELDSLDGSEDLQDAVRIILSALAAGSAK